MPRSAAIIHAFEAGTELTGAAVQKGPRGNVAYEGINAPGLAPASLFEAQLISRFGSLPPDVAPPAAGKPAQGSGDGVVITTLPSLDPPCGTQVFISAELDGSTDGFEVAIFSRANALCASQKISGSFGKGWHSIGVDAADLAAEIYLYEVQSTHAGRKSKAPKIGKLAILR